MVTDAMSDYELIMHCSFSYEQKTVNYPHLCILFHFFLFLCG